MAYFNETNAQNYEKRAERYEAKDNKDKAQKMREKAAALRAANPAYTPEDLEVKVYDPIFRAPRNQGFTARMVAGRDAGGMLVHWAVFNVHTGEAVKEGDAGSIKTAQAAAQTRINKLCK